MTAVEDFERWFQDGTFSPYVEDRRLVASTPAWMFDTRQPAGDFPDPPFQEMVVIQDKFADAGRLQSGRRAISIRSRKYCRSALPL